MFQSHNHESQLPATAGAKLVRVGPPELKIWGYRFKEELVTPEQAKAWVLMNAASNRRLSSSRIENFALMVLRREWKRVPSPVCILPDGRLGNGQHRMMGVAWAGEKAKEQGLVVEPVPMLFCYDVPHDVVLELDRGRAQSLSDTEIIDGDPKAKPKTEIARVFLPLESRPNSAMERGVFHDIIAALGKDHVEAVTARTHKKGATAPVKAAFVYARPISPEKVDAMFDELLVAFGEGTSDVTVKALMQMLSKVSAYDRVTTFHRTLRAIEAFVKGGKTIQILREDMSGYAWAMKEREKLHLPAQVVPSDYRPDTAEKFLRKLGLDANNR